MTGITLHKMSLSFNTSSNTQNCAISIPFDPPLPSSSDARARLVAMANTAVISRLPLAQHPPPPLPQFIVMAIVWTYIVGYRVKVFIYIPQSVIQVIFVSAILCHLLESLYALHIIRRTCKKVACTRALAWWTLVFMYGFPALRILLHGVRVINAPKSEWLILGDLSHFISLFPWCIASVLPHFAHLRIFERITSYELGYSHQTMLICILFVCYWLLKRSKDMPSLDVTAAHSGNEMSPSPVSLHVIKWIIVIEVMW